MPKSAHNSPFPHRPFLRRQESHSAVHAISPNPPPIPIPPQLIPAKAGISQCSVPQFAKYAAIPLSPIRPFLRRQESHSVVHTISPNPPPIPIPPQTIPAKAGISQSCAANGGVIKAAMPPMAMRFLLSQEWSSGEREYVCVFWRLCIYDTVRFLPTQEWSCGGRGYIAKNTPDCCPHNYQNPPPIPIPPTDHSCVGRNLTVSCMQYRQIRRRFPFPTDHSCVGRNLTVPCMQISPNPPPIPIPPTDHSCEGRNLTIVCRQRRRILGGDAAHG